jgi:ABC-type phosphate transport system substrate-binding protein
MINQPLNRIRCLAMAAAVLCGLPAMARADIYVIVNAAMTVNVADIKAIYTGDIELAGAVKLKPVDNHAAQAEFLSKVLQLNASRYDSLWTMKSFRDGLVPPVSKAGDEEIIAFVKATPGAIGYVTAPPPAGVVVLKKY